MVYAVLTGTRQRPRIEVAYPSGTDGEMLAARLRDTMGFEVDAETRRCVAHAPTNRLIGQLREAGIVLDAFEFPESLASLRHPLVIDLEDGRIEVFSRLAGRASVIFYLGEEATFDPSRGAFTAPAAAVADWPDRLLPTTLRGPNDPTPTSGPTTAPTSEQTGRQARLDLPRASRIENPTTPAQAAQNLAEAADADGMEREVELLTDHVGYVPDWFGMTPYPYQRIGALCVAAGGRRLLADAPGLGKSVQAILAAVLLAAKRWIVVCPPVAQSGWAAEIDRCCVPENLEGEASVAVIRPGRKVPDLPETGIVIVTDSLLAAPTRHSLLDDLQGWGADVLIYDEGHRAKNWETHRATAMRRLAVTARDRIVLTGTPIMSNPADLPPILAIAGVLNATFGSRSAFMARYTRSYEIPVGNQTIEKIVPVKKHLGELGRILREQVWVRRTKDQVLPDLPEKLHSTMIVDVPTTEYRKATGEVREQIHTYLRERTRELGRAPSEREVQAWCSDQMGCVSQLRDRKSTRLNSSHV